MIRRSPVEDDLFALFAQLVERLRRELQRRHIEPGDLTRYQITKEDTLRGRITWDDDTKGEVPCLVIDGKELSWHEVGSVFDQNRIRVRNLPIGG